MPLRERVPQRCKAEPTALQGEIRPAQAGLALAAQNQVDAPTPRVGVDEQRIGRRLRQRGRKDRCTGPAAAGDHADNRATPILVARRVGGVGQLGHQLPVMRGQRDDMLRAHLDGGLEVGGLRFGADHQNDPAAPRQRSVRAATGGRHIE